jgi:hypothetical protein
MLDTVAQGYESHEASMTHLKSTTYRRIFRNSAVASRRRSCLLYIVLVIGYIWPVLSLWQPDDLNIARTQERFADSSVLRSLKSDNDETTEGEGSKHGAGPEGNKNVAPDPPVPGTASENSKPEDDKTPEGPVKPPGESGAKGEVEGSPLVESEATNPTEVSPAPSSSPTLKTVDPPASLAPSASPTLKISSAPSASPAVKMSPATTASPTRKETPAPSPAPTEKESPAPSPAPTEKDSPAPSPAPSKKSIDPPTKTNVEPEPPTDEGDLEACSRAKNCTECKEMATSLATEDGYTKTCVWKDGTCQLVGKVGALPLLCDIDSPPVDSEESLFLNRPGQAVFGGLVVLVFVCILLRRYMKRSANARVNNTMNYGKYQGVYVKIDFDDESSLDLP